MNPRNLYIDRLKVTGFRGIRDAIDLRLGRRLTLIYGGNASGKSSLTQAIEYALSGRVLDPDEKPVATQYLNHTHNEKWGSVHLEFTNGDTVQHLTAAVNEPAGSIEARFRDVGSVSWPEKQPLPVTHTHITTQGMLSRAVAADSVTRNDLSGLCASAQLRTLLSRAEKLSAYFRQGSTGRNIQNELKEARTALDAARVLHESLSAFSTAPARTEADGHDIFRRLADDVALPDAKAISEILTALENRLAVADTRLLTIQRLRARIQDLGQYEVELNQAKEIIRNGKAAESTVAKGIAELQARFDQQEEAQKALSAKRDRAIAVLSAFDRSQRAIASVESLRQQLTRLQQSLAQLNSNADTLASALDIATKEHSSNSELLVRLSAEKNTALERLKTIREALDRLSTVPDAVLNARLIRLKECDQLLRDARDRLAVAAEALQLAAESSTTLSQEMRLQSEDVTRFLTAVSALESLILDDECTLCGHSHGSRLALEQAIAKVKERRISGADSRRVALEKAMSLRQDRQNQYDQTRNAVQIAESSLAEAQRSYDRLASQREATSAFVRESLARHGLQSEVSELALMALRDSLEVAAKDLEKPVQEAMLAEEDSRVRRSDIEQELTVRRSAAQQARSLSQELQGQLHAVGSTQPPTVSNEAASLARSDLIIADGEGIELQRTMGQVRAELAQQDRLLSDARSATVSGQHRLVVVEALLKVLDEDLAQVGATRDIAGLLSLEGNARQERDETLVFRDRSFQVKETLAQIERDHARLAADQQLRDAQESLQSLQDKQRLLSQRSEQFARLQRELEIAQSSTAEEVLRIVRGPVGLMFRAMTAGCQWDVEFALSLDGRVEARLRDPSGIALPATSVLNSAYLNVSAIALRIALASQQNWTTLRTVVLDDPILEMDSLTQSALIDGFEAILMSPNAPWSNLQLALTTWSEDFAILAAHKLAHMNQSGLAENDFVIYRLNTTTDGGIKPERHTPRWSKQASAA